MHWTKVCCKIIYTNLAIFYSGCKRSNPSTFSNQKWRYKNKIKYQEFFQKTFYTKLLTFDIFSLNVLCDKNNKICLLEIPSKNENVLIIGYRKAHPQMLVVYKYGKEPHVMYVQSVEPLEFTKNASMFGSQSQIMEKAQ